MSGHRRGEQPSPDRRLVGTVYARMPDDVTDAIDALALKTGYSKTAVTEWALRRGMALVSMADRLQANAIGKEIPGAGHDLMTVTPEGLAGDFTWRCYCGAASGGWERFDGAAAAYARHAMGEV